MCMCVLGVHKPRMCSNDKVRQRQNTYFLRQNRNAQLGSQSSCEPNPPHRQVLLFPFPPHFLSLSFPHFLISISLSFPPLSLSFSPSLYLLPPLPLPPPCLSLSPSSYPLFLSSISSLLFPSLSLSCSSPLSLSFPPLPSLPIVLSLYLVVPPRFASGSSQIPFPLILPIKVHVIVHGASTAGSSSAPRSERCLYRTSQMQTQRNFFSCFFWGFWMCKCKK